MERMITVHKGTACGPTVMGPLALANVPMPPPPPPGNRTLMADYTRWSLKILTMQLIDADRRGVNVR